jgi:[amino group carrier protein]-L-2-aminoadipate 6-kinase
LSLPACIRTDLTEREVNDVTAHPPQTPVVIKCGGSAAADPAAICADVAALVAAGQPVVLVHGGSADIDRLAARLGVPVRRLTSPEGMSARFTGQDTLEVVSMALAGLVRPRLVTALLAAGVPAIGLTGVDGALLRARHRRTQRAIAGGRQVVVRGDRSGHITGVRTDLLGCLIAAGFVPVISPPVLAEDDSVLNADADRVAAAVAGAMHASTLLLLTGAPGVLADLDDPRSVLPTCLVRPAGPPPELGGGIGVKLLAARDALAAGVPAVLIAGGAGPAPVRRALSGAATRIRLSAPPPARQPR